MQTFGDRLFYRPTQRIYAHPEDVHLAYESVFFESDDCRLHGWFFPAKQRAKGTVIHCHGNAGNITGHFKYVAWMPARGWNVLCFDYRGYGKSQGRPTRKDTVRDARAAIEYAGSRSDVDPSRMALFGQSLGGAIGIVAAAGRRDLCGVIIEGAFSNYRRAAHFACRQHILLWAAAPLLSRTFIHPGYDPMDSVAGIAPIPTLFITGTADRTCDPSETLELYAGAGEPKSLWAIEGGRHTAALTDTDGEGCRRIEAFLSQCGW